MHDIKTSYCFRGLCFVMAFLVVSCTFYSSVSSRYFLARGAKTSGDITSPGKVLGGHLKSAEPSEYAGSFKIAFADTTKEDLGIFEEKKSHLARDITVFIIVSAFVGYFIAKVFIQGDTDENPPENTGGKKFPPPQFYYSKRIDFR